MQETEETWVWPLGWEDPLEEGMATHFSVLAWIIPQTEEPGELWSIGWQRVRHMYLFFWTVLCSWANKSMQKQTKGTYEGKMGRYLSLVLSHHPECLHHHLISPNQFHWLLLKEIQCGYKEDEELDWLMEITTGFPDGTSGKESTCQCRGYKRRGFDPWVEKIPWRRAWQPTSVFLHGESHGQSSLVGYSP